MRAAGGTAGNPAPPPAVSNPDAAPASNPAASSTPPPPGRWPGRPSPAAPGVSPAERPLHTRVSGGAARQAQAVPQAAAGSRGRWRGGSEALMLHRHGLVPFSHPADGGSARLEPAALKATGAPLHCARSGSAADRPCAAWPIRGGREAT